jgi:hypothetical protein
MAKKGFASQPKQHRRIFPNAPEHRQVVELIKGFAQYIDALIFEF